MNGEPIPHNDVSVNVAQLGFNSDVQKSLKSDADGAVKLGKLPLGTSLNVNGNTPFGNFNKAWRINDRLSEISYSSVIYYKKGEKISLPLASNMALNDFIIQKKQQNNTIV